MTFGDFVVGLFLFLVIGVVVFFLMFRMLFKKKSKSDKRAYKRIYGESNAVTAFSPTEFSVMSHLKEKSERKRRANRRRED